MTRIVKYERHETTISLTAAELENLERRTIAFLYAIWSAQGVKKKIVPIAGSNGHFEDIEETMKDDRRSNET